MSQIYLNVPCLPYPWADTPFGQTPPGRQPPWADIPLADTSLWADTHLGRHYPGQTPLYHTPSIPHPSIPPLYQTPPCGQNEWHTLVKIVPSPILRMRSVEAHKKQMNWWVIWFPAGYHNTLERAWWLICCKSNCSQQRYRNQFDKYVLQFCTCTLYTFSFQDVQPGKCPKSIPISL